MQPNRFAALVPICGGGDPAQRTETARPHPRLGISRRPKIRQCRWKCRRRMVDALKKTVGNPKLTIYPEAAHDSWTQAYNTPELYEWLLQQKRTGNKSDESKK